MNLRFSDLPAFARHVIIGVAVSVFLIAAASFAISYSAIYALVRDSGMFSDRMARLFPLLLDAAFIVGQLLAMVIGALAGNRFWPYMIIGSTGVLTIWFNLQHAGADPGHRLLGVVPPLLMILCFEGLLYLVKLVRRILAGDAAGDAVGGRVAGALSRLDGSSNKPTVTGHNGHAGMQSGGAAAGAVTDLVNKRRMVGEYLESLSPEELQRTTAAEVKATFEAEGVQISESTVAQALRSYRKQLANGSH